MAWELSNDKPIYLQIIERVQRQIVSGFYRPGDKLPSVRELAAEAGVNPNTMQKAFGELERSELIVTLRTSGRVVTEDTKLIQDIKKTMAQEQIKAFFEKMKEIGFEKEETLKLMETADEEEK